MHGKLRSTAFAKMSIVLMSMSLLLGSCADTGQSVYGTQTTSEATASFTPPDGCQPSSALAAKVGASQACVQRFSPTHEFIVTLSEYRKRADSPESRMDAKKAKVAVSEHSTKLVEMNQQRAASFEDLESRAILFGIPPPKYPEGFQVLEKDWIKPERRAPGADHCMFLSTNMADRQVPGHKGRIFILPARTVICAKADESENIVQVVQISATERLLWHPETVTFGKSRPHEGYSEKARAALDSLVMK